MAKKTKITATAIAKAMELVDVNPVVIMCGMGDDAVEVSIKTHLSLSERAMMVNDVINMIFIGSDSEIRYCPMFKKFAIEFNIVSYFTDIALPTGSDKAFKFLERSGFVDRIIQALPEGYVSGIINDINEAIEYRKQELLKKSKFDELFDSVLSIVKALNDKTEKIDFPQIMEYVEENMPEFKGQLEQLISAQLAEATTTT